MKESRALWVGIAAFAVVALVSHLHATPYNNYVLLANALLHGRVWIDWPGPYIDALAFGGKHYVIEAPLPAILLLPYVLLAGTAANQTLLSAALAAIALGTAWRIGELLKVPLESLAWLCMFLLFGTDLLWCAMLGDVWFIAHVSAVCFTLLALCELAGARRGWLVALWALCAAESRFSLALAIPVYAVMLATPRNEQTRMKLGSFCAVLLAGFGFWAWYNVARWGTLADIGYTTWYHQDTAGMPSGSPFRLMYVPYQLWSFFVQMPGFSSSFPWFRPSLSGVALTWTSPALIFALWARRPRNLILSLWAAAVVAAAPSFVYYVNGYSQYGMRHALDFIPFLFVLMLLAARDRLPMWTKILIGYSCAASSYGVWYWKQFIRS